MRKILIIAFLLVSVVSQAQINAITDSATLRYRINADITANGQRAITGTQLNRILNGLMNVMPKMSSTGLPITRPTANTTISGGGNYSYTLDSMFSVLINTSRFSLNLGSDATGDIYYRNSLGLFQRLPIGTTGTVLQSNGTTPFWGTAAGGAGGTYTDAMARAAVTSLLGSEFAYTDSIRLSNIAASKIIQTALYRFVTDAEKAYWNGKLNAADTVNRWQPKGNYLTPADTVALRVTINNIINNGIAGGGIVDGTGLLDPLYRDADGRVGVRYWYNVFRASHIQNRYVSPQVPKNREFLAYDSLQDQWRPMSVDSVFGLSNTYTDAQARAAISLTTTGTSGAATYNPSTGVLNIPNYTGVGGADDSAIVRIQNIGDTIHRYFRRNGEAAYDVKLDCSTCGGSGTGTGTTYTFNASSVKLTGSNITLQGDVNAPGANKVYGTNASGTKGWQGATLVDTTGQANGKILEFQNGEVVAGHTADSIQVSTTTPTHGNHYFNPSDTSYNVRYSGVWFKFKANGGATGGGGEEPQGMDVDALAYITAAESGGAVFSTAYETAISNFVTDLKTAGIYSTHFDAIWLGTGGSEAGVKLNLLNPQNTDAAYRLTFNNGATFAATGVTGNGSNQTISTHLIPGLAAKMGDNDSHVFVYQRSTTATDNPVWGINQAGSQIYLFPKESGGAGAWKYTNKTNHSFTPSDASGLWLASKGGNTFLHRNNILIVETQDSELGDILSNDYDIVFNGWNSNGTPGLAHAAELSLMSVGRFMNETQRLAFHNAVTTFLTTIGAL